MPLYAYQCSFCNYEFEEFYKINENSGKTFCPKCGNVSFKIPTIFIARIFKPRKFVDGTETPSHIRTHKQEKKWMNEKGITYDKPTGKERRQRQEERRKQSETAMSIAFKKAVERIEQGGK